MKKVRVMSNLIADELKIALDESGIQLDEDVFEGQVSSIVEMVSESVKKACEGDDCEDCDDEDIEEEDDEEVVSEGTFYFATADCALDGINVAEGEYVEIEDTDDGSYITVYNEDGDVVSEFISISDEDKEKLLASVEELEEGEDDDEVEEAPVKKFKVKNGKKVKLTKNQIARNKLKARGKLKKGYKFVDGKQVKMTSAEKLARKKLGKKLARKGKAKRMKSLKKARQLAAGSNSGTCTVKEGFDINVNGIKLSLEEGDEVKFEDGKITVIRDGKVIFSEVQVSESFMDRCFEEQVLEKKCNEEDDDEEDDSEEEESEVDAEAEAEEDPEDSDDEEDEDKDVDECGNSKTNEEDEEEKEEEKVEESAILTFKANKGFVYVKEGVELPMGNRIRARATLASKGYAVTAEMLDNASKGQVVVL